MEEKTKNIMTSIRLSKEHDEMLEEIAVEDIAVNKKLIAKSVILSRILEDIKNKREKTAAKLRQTKT